MFGLKFNSGTSKVLLTVACFVLASIVACTGVANAQTRTSYVHLADRATTTGTSLASVTTLFSDSAGNVALHRSGAGYLRFVVPASGEAVGLTDTDIGSSVQGYDADTAKLDVAQNWTASQSFGAIGATSLDCPTLQSVSSDQIELNVTVITSPSGGNDFLLQGTLDWNDANGDTCVALLGAAASNLAFQVGDIDVANTGYYLKHTAAAGAEIKGPAVLLDANGDTLVSVTGTVSSENSLIKFGDVDVAVGSPLLTIDANDNTTYLTGAFSAQDIYANNLFFSANAGVTATGTTILPATRMMLQAGRAASTSASANLQSDGVGHSTSVGWIMPSSGSIVGLAVGMNVTSYTSGDAALVVRKNGSDVFQTNDFATATGWQTTYKTQARGVDTFAAGDRLSMYISIDGTLTEDNLLATLVIVLD